MPPVSLVVTTLNEARSIDRFFASVVQLHQLPDEIILVDGGSSDQTVAMARKYAAPILPLQIIELPNSSIAAGRNHGISHARNEIIAVTDAGCVLDPDWLHEITLPFENATTDVVSGWYTFSGDSPVQRATRALTDRRVSDIHTDDFLPSSRSFAFRKTVWSRVGGYPEWLTFAAEDTLFCHQLRRVGAHFTFAPRACVQWELRPTFRALFRQYYRYGYGDAEARLETRTWWIKHTYVLTLGGCITLGVIINPLFFWLAGLVASSVILTPRSLRAYVRLPSNALTAAIVKYTTFFAQYIGYWTGLLHGHRQPS